MTELRQGYFQKRLSPSQSAALVADIAGGMSKAAAARKHGVSNRTVFRILRDDYSGAPKTTQPCGTNAGYARHLRRGERCWECSAAHAANQKEWHDGKRKRNETAEQDAAGG